jgi:hypothetical protein
MVQACSTARVPGEEAAASTGLVVRTLINALVSMSLAYRPFVNVVISTHFVPPVSSSVA